MTAAPRSDALSPQTARAPRVLVVDDERPIVELVRGYLVREGMEVLIAHDGRAALEAVRHAAPDVVVLDLMLPGLDGLEVCRQLRAFSDAYVIMLTARSEEVDRVVGLSVGADDYLVKPFSPRELVARIRAMLRRPRTTPATASVFHLHGMVVDESRRTVTVDDRPVGLTPTEFRLLLALVREPALVLTRQRLLEEVWGSGFFGDDHLLDVHIGKLRRKLGDDAARPRFLETVRGVGFRLAGER